VRGTNAVVPLDSSDETCLYTHGGTHLLADVQGYLTRRCSRRSTLEFSIHATSSCNPSVWFNRRMCVSNDPTQRSGTRQRDSNSIDRNRKRTGAIAVGAGDLLDIHLASAKRRGPRADGVGSGPIIKQPTR
jgi:hypothetical protein